jgi:branched-chain amino acid transport system ATP-binding protein
MILKISNLEAFYGLSQVLFGLNIEVHEGSVVCILGRNGVGKSTTLKCIMGLLNPKLGSETRGSIVFRGSELVGLPSYKLARKGIAYVPQGRRIFPKLTVKENLLIAERTGVDGEKFWNLDRIYELFPRLKERETSRGDKLSGGEQQMLAIARGLMQNPKLLIMDEIIEGLAPIIVEELTQVMKELRKQGITILLAEQSVKFALEVSDRCYIIEKGEVVYTGDSDSIPSDVLIRHIGA